MPPKRQTRSVAGQQPAQQQQTQQREEQEGDVPVTLWDIDLRDMALGDDMPALSDNAQGWCESDERTDVLRRREGCTIEALVVDTHACCKSDGSVQAVQRLPWWWLAMQMRLLLENRIFTLGHWAELSEDDRGNVPDIRDMLDTQVAAQQQAAARRGGVTTELTLTRKYEASERASDAVESFLQYLTLVRVDAAKASVLAENALQAATAMTAQPTATTITAQPRQLPPLDIYGQETKQLLSAAVGKALYDSVYKATWGALQYTTRSIIKPEFSAAEDVVLPIVPCGTLPEILVMDDSSVAAAQRASTAPDVLTLYSPLGWPAMWRLGNLPKRAPSSDEVERRVTAASAAQQLVLGSVDYKNTLFVRGEVQRAWRCVVHARDMLQRQRQGSATTQGTATAAAAPARAQGEHDNDAEEATTQAQAQAPNDDHNDASEVHVPAQNGEHVNAAKAPAQTQALVTDEQQTSTATSAANVQAQGEPHDDAAEAQGQTHEQTKQHSDSTKAQGQLQAGGKQGDNAAEAHGQRRRKARKQNKNVDIGADMMPHVLVRGTPGIGKSMAVGGYVLYKLLHDESERALPYVLFEVNKLSFVFDKRNKTVACYKRKSFDAGDFVRAVDSQCARIFDCSKRIAYDEDHYDDIGEINIVLTSPNVKNTEDFLRRLQSDNMIFFCTMHAWTLREMLLVGRYVGITPNTVVERVRHVGPVPRHVFTLTMSYWMREAAVTRAAANQSYMQKLPIPLCVVHDVVFDDQQNPTNVLYDMRRETDAFYDDDTIIAKAKRGARVPQKAACLYYFVPLSPYICGKLMETMTNKAKQNTDYLARVLATCAAHPGALEHFVLQSLTYESFWQLCAHAVGKKRKYCMYMPRGGDGAAADEPDTPLRRDTLRAWLAGMTEHNVACFDDGATITFDTRSGMRVFVPRSRAFPLVDAFVLVYYAECVHYIGIQVTDSDSHRPTADNVRSFYVRHPKIVVAGADGLTPQQPSLTRATPPTVQVSTRVDSPAMQEASVDVLDKKVLGNVNGTRSMLYVKKYDGNNVSYQQLQSATDVPEDVAQNWHTYAQYCCRVRDRYW